MRYEWDDEKARINLVKHGIDFVDAIAALQDPRRLEIWTSAMRTEKTEL